MPARASVDAQAERISAYALHAGRNARSETVASHKLIGPANALKRARRDSGRAADESALCRWNDEFVYEITLLRRNGKVVHVFTNAADGEADEPKN